MTLREGTATDMDRIVEMAVRFIDTTQYSPLLRAAQPAQLRALCGLLFEIGTVIVGEDAGELIGMIAMAAVNSPVNGEYIAEEVVWWVEPERRSGSLGPRLLAAAEAWALRKGCTSVKMVAPVNTNVGHFLERHGYTAVETAFVKRLA